MTVLELAETGEMDLARATLRLSMDELSEGMQLSIERRLQELSTLRRRAELKLPNDYYGEDGVTRQQQRDDLAHRLMDAVPIAPRGRLMTLLQQAIKWQAHTGQLPILEEEEENVKVEDEKSDEEGDKKDGSKKRKKRKRTIAYDLVLGEPMIPARYSKDGAQGKLLSDGTIPPERIPSKQLGHIKFGKKSHPECAVFLPDGQGLATGSSDGFIEIWDPKKCKLRTYDLPYQKDDDLMLHDTAVLAINYSRDGEMLATGSSDGMVRVWKIVTGKCLRQFEHAHSEAISCITFSVDGTKVLTGAHDCLCREFGLRATKMLKEFRGHSSYINTCAYANETRIVTSAADGTVRVWDAKSSELKQVIRPGASLSEERSVHSLLLLHTPATYMIAVPRGNKAYLLDYSGGIVRTFESESPDKDFVAAVVSPSNKWLYCVTAEDRICLCFDVRTGKVEGRLQLHDECDVKGLVHHPHMGTIATFGVEGKRGGVRVWK